jgi:iron complex outermembrane receptor protein
MSAVTGNGKAYTSSGLNSDRIPGTERHLISLQYSDADFSARTWSAKSITVTNR